MRILSRNIFSPNSPDVFSRKLFVHSTLGRTRSRSFSYSYVPSRLAHSFPLALLRNFSPSAPMSISLSLSPGNVLARGGHRVIGFIPEETGSRPEFGLVPRYPGIQASRCSVASTACRRRLSNVLSSDNYADEAVSYDNAAEDLAASSPSAISGRNTWLQQICDWLSVHIRKHTLR